MDIQKLLDSMSEVARAERSRYHVTLGNMIAELIKVAADTPVEFSHGHSPGTPHSYRGYYSDLSFEPGSDPITAGDLLKVCTTALGTTFKGYKGGDFRMGPNTPLWAATYGCTGPAIVALTATLEKVILTTKDIE